MNILAYNFIKEEVFEKISSKEIEDLFFSSLFDPSSWEETTKTRFSDDHSKCQRKALEILSQNKILKSEIEKNTTKVCNDLIESERLTNYILAFQLEKKSEQLTIDKTKLSKREFPDMSLSKDKNDLSIEIKRLISANDLEVRIRDEVVGALKRDKDNHKDILLLLLFPVFSGEDAERIFQLIKGYYVYETIICRETKSNCKVLCRCFKPNDDTHCLETLGSKILNNPLVISLQK